MKPWVKVLILVAALAVCIAACFIVVDVVKNSEDKPEEETETVLVGGFESDVVGFTYSYNGASTEFELVNYSWQNTADREMPLRQDDLDDLAIIIREGAVSVRLVDDTGDLVNSENFGLASPVLSVKANDGVNEKVINFGSYNSAFSAYYANVEGSPVSVR